MYGKKSYYETRAAAIPAELAAIEERMKALANKKRITPADMWDDEAWDKAIEEWQADQDGYNALLVEDHTLRMQFAKARVTLEGKRRDRASEDV